MTKRRIWFLFVLTLIAGMLAGAAVMQVYIQTRLKVFMRGEQEHYYEYFLRRLRVELKLNDAQYVQVASVILANQEQLQLLRQRTQPEVEQLATQANAKIEQCLTPAQIDQLKVFLVRFPEPGLHGLNPSRHQEPAKP